MSKVITRYLKFMRELYQLLEYNMDQVNIDPQELKKIRCKYKKYKQERGAEMNVIYHITHDEPFPDVDENADFSPEMIKNSIKEGEMRTTRVLNEHQDQW